MYLNDSDIIPKNSRVQINRVVKNIGPAIAGGTVTSTHKQNEQLADMRLKQQQQMRNKRSDSLELDEPKVSNTFDSSLYSDLLDESSHNGTQLSLNYKPNIYLLNDNYLKLNHMRQIDAELTKINKAPNVVGLANLAPKSSVRFIYSFYSSVQENKASIFFFFSFKKPMQICQIKLQKNGNFF